MPKIFISLFFVITTLYAAYDLPDFESGETLEEQKTGNEFAKHLWDSGLIIEDIETYWYIKNLGYKLKNHSNSPNKHFEFYMLNIQNINAFAGPYGYIGVHSGLFFATDNESELASVLAHEIAHITQNHLKRYIKDTNKHLYIVLAGILASLATKDVNTSEAIISSSIGGVSQRSINFIRKHEWEADRLSMKMLVNAGFDAKGMPSFFHKLLKEDSGRAAEFLRTHPLSINRVSDSEQRATAYSGGIKTSLSYEIIKAKLEYNLKERFKSEDKIVKQYIKAYIDFKKQKYSSAIKTLQSIEYLDNKEIMILLARAYSKLKDLDSAIHYFDKVYSIHREYEPTQYYQAIAYAENNKIDLAIKKLRFFLKNINKSPQGYNLLASLYLKQKHTDRFHIASADALIIKKELNLAKAHLEKAKLITNSDYLFKIINAKIESLNKL